MKILQSTPDVQETEAPDAAETPGATASPEAHETKAPGGGRP